MLGTPPPPRYGHALAPFGGSLFLSGGVSLDGKVLADVHQVPTPRRLAWPDASDFHASMLDSYDWDTFLLPSTASTSPPPPPAANATASSSEDAPAAAAAAVLPSRLRLCTGELPCALSLVGDGGAVGGADGAGPGGGGGVLLLRTGDGSFSCDAQDGCQGISVWGVRLVCDDAGAVAAFLRLNSSSSSPSSPSPTAAASSSSPSTPSASTPAAAAAAGAATGGLQAPLQVDGAVLTVERSSIEDCTAVENGGAIRALRSTVVVSDSTFLRSRSLSGSGGALSLAGSSATIKACNQGVQLRRVHGGGRRGGRLSGGPHVQPLLDHPIQHRHRRRAVPRLRGRGPRRRRRRPRRPALHHRPGGVFIRAGPG